MKTGCVMKKATALVLVLIVTIIITLGTATILQAIISYIRLREITTDRIRAQYLVEAGMQAAVSQCLNGNFGSPVNISTEEWPIVITKTRQPDGSYNITVSVQYPGI